MTRFIIILISLFMFSCKNTKSLSRQNESKTIGSSMGKIQRFHLISTFVDNRNIDVWLPEGYNDSKKYAVLYMQDGQMLFDSTTTWNRQEWKVDETMSRLIGEEKIRPTIVVGIWNNGPKRHAEYFPQKVINTLPEEARMALDSLMPGGPKADDYLKFLVNELKPFIDKTFSTDTSSLNNFICGSSMGGLISLYALCEYPKVFSGAACLSTHWPATFRANDIIPASIIRYAEENLPPPALHKIYFDHGTETLDALYPPHQKSMDRVMKTKGYDASHWMTRIFPGTAHTEHAWADRLELPLQFLLK
jgi:enterochelin esterase-like enzyme